MDCQLKFHQGFQGIPLPPVGISTRYKCLGVNIHTGRERVLSGWSPNILLTSGRNSLATQNWSSWCKVGTDSTVPNANQTNLLAQIAATNTVVETTYGANPIEPYFGWKRKRFRFSPAMNIGNENLNEVSLGWGSANTSNCATRSLLLNSSEEQTTVTPLPDEFLDVIAEIRYYPPLVDATGVLVLNGVNYNYILRASIVTDEFWGQYAGDPISAYAVYFGDWYATDGDINSILLGPDGVTYGGQAADYNDAYVNNSYQLKFGLTGLAGDWNATTGKLLRSLRFLTTAGAYQIQFDSQANPGFGIPKTSGDYLASKFVIAWQEHVS